MVAGYNAEGQLEIYGHNPAHGLYKKLGSFYHETEAGIEHNDLEVWVVNMDTTPPDHDHRLWYDHEGNAVGKYEEEHPHLMYDMCTVDGCDLKYYLGWRANVSFCTTCNPSPNGKPEVTLTETETGGIKVFWTALEDVAEYEVWRAKKAGGTFAKIEYTSLGTQMTNTAVAPGATYYYKVVAVLETGGTVESDVKSITLKGTLPKPELTVSLSAENDPILSWETVKDADGYEVYRSTKADSGFEKIFTFGPNQDSFANGDTMPGNVYYYKVVALYGDVTSESEVRSIYYTEGMSNSGKPELTLSLNGETAIRLDWTTLAGEGNTYQVKRARSKNGTYYNIGQAAAASSMINSANILPGVRYYYKVVAVLPDGNEVAGDAVGITVPGTAEAPALAVEANAKNYPVLTWNTVSGADGYRLFRSTALDGEYAKVADFAPATTTYTNDSVVAGMTYYYKMATIFGETLAMSESQKFAYPEANMSVSGKPETSLSLENGAVRVDWTALDGAKEYQVWRSRREYGTYYQIGDGFTRTAMINPAVLPGVKYYYKTVAVMNNGDEIYGDPSNIVAAGQIARPTLTVTINENGDPVLSWTTVSDADGYQLSRSTEENGEYVSMAITAPTTTRYTNDDAEPGVTYYYKAAAIFGETLGESEIQSVTIPASDTPEVELSITAEGAVKLVWAEVANVAEYQVWRARSEDGTYYPIGGGVTYHSMINSAVMPGAIYFYKVEATLKNGDKVESQIKSISIPGELSKPELTVVLNDAKQPVLTWTAVESTDGYKVWRATEEDGTYDVVRVAAPATTSYTNEIVAAGTTYYYKIEALFGAASSFSEVKSIQCPATLPAPTVTVTNNALTGNPVINWTAVEGATGYQVCGSDNSESGFRVIYEAGADELRVTQGGVAVGSERFYKVRAMKDNVAGVYSAVENGWVCLPRPTITVTGRASDGKPVISWTAVEGAVRYDVHRSTGSSDSYSKLISTTGLNVTNTSVEAGNSYSYKVIAIHSNSACNSAYSTVKSMQYSPKQSAPTITVTKHISSGKPYITWTPVSGATKYALSIYESATGAATKTVTTTGTAITHSSAVSGKTYYYTVKAFVGGSYGAASNKVSISLTTSSAPQVSVKLNTSGKPVISWKAVEGATGYDVYRSTSSDGSYSKLITTTGLSVTNTSAAVGNNYFYKVRALYGDKQGEVSEVKSAWCSLKQPVITVTGRASDGKPVISWKAVEGAARYDVYRSIGSSDSYSKLISTTKLNVTNTSVEAGNTYSYKVIAIHSNSACNSLYSAVKSITVP